MTDFKSSKPKPVWAQASQRLGGVTPDEIHRRQGIPENELNERSQVSRRTIDPSADDRFEIHKSAQELYRYADEKKRTQAPVKTDAIVRKPRRNH